MVPDGKTEIYKIAGRYILYRDFLTNAKVKKYYSHSTDLKIFLEISGSAEVSNIETQPFDERCVCMTSNHSIGRCYNQLAIADIFVIQILQTVHTRNGFCKHYIISFGRNLSKKNCATMILTDRCIIFYFWNIKQMFHKSFYGVILLFESKHVLCYAVKSIILDKV